MGPQVPMDGTHRELGTNAEADGRKVIAGGGWCGVGAAHTHPGSAENRNVTDERGCQAGSEQSFPPSLVCVRVCVCVCVCGVFWFPLNHPAGGETQSLSQCRCPRLPRVGCICSYPSEGRQYTVSFHRMGSGIFDGSSLCSLQGLNTTYSYGERSGLSIPGLFGKQKGQQPLQNAAVPRWSLL